MAAVEALGGRLFVEGLLQRSVPEVGGGAGGHAALVEQGEQMRWSRVVCSCLICQRSVDRPVDGLFTSLHGCVVGSSDVRFAQSAFKSAKCGMFRSMSQVVKTNPRTGSD